MNNYFNPRLSSSREAFSLVEVTFCIAIAVFCLVTLMALLPVGFSQLSSSREQTAGSLTLQQIATSIRNASTNGAGSYQALGSYSNLTWNIGGNMVSANYTNSLDGIPTTSVSDQRLVVHVELTPPANTVSSGTALISVAWPKTAVWGTTNWTKAVGSTSSGLIFLPAP